LIGDDEDASWEHTSKDSAVDDNDAKESGSEGSDPADDRAIP
jgi:hypothetical protein